MLPRAVIGYYCLQVNFCSILLSDLSSHNEGKICHLHSNYQVHELYYNFYTEKFVAHSDHIADSVVVFLVPGILPGTPRAPGTADLSLALDSSGSSGTHASATVGRVAGTAVGSPATVSLSCCAAVQSGIGFGHDRPIDFSTSGLDQRSSRWIV